MLPSYPESVRRKLARNVLRTTLRLKRGESVTIESWSGTLPWAESFVLEARILGARPMLLLEDETTYWKSIAEAPTANLGQVGAHEFGALKETDAYVYLAGPMDTAREETRRPSLDRRIGATDHEWLRITQKFGVRAVRWDLGRTNAFRARRYGVNLARWRNELIEAATFDARILRRDGRRIARSLRHGSEVVVSHPNGTNLRLRLAGRTPFVDDGVVDEQDIRAGSFLTTVPSGVSMVTVDERCAEGSFIGNTPGVVFVHMRDTPLPPGAWTFRDGHLRDYSFDVGGEEFHRAFRRSGPGKDRPGLISVGLNPQISSIPLLFDQARGRICLGIGRNSFYGGATRRPHFVAYQSLRGGSVAIDGRLVVDAGRLV
jgi:leucyl aminopeptidase (aminopeptidase T)